MDLKSKLLSILLVSTLLLPITSLFAEDKVKVIIGIRAFQGADMAYKNWNATMEYLNQNIKGYQFRMLPLVDYEEIETKVKNKTIDFYIGDPASYVEFESMYGMTRLATLQRKKDGFYFDKFGSVIFTSSENKDINTLADLKGKVFMGVSPSAFAAYRVAYRELIDKGIEPNKVFKNTLFSGGRGDVVVHEVLSKKEYVGTVRTGLLEAMVQRGEIKREDFKIINPIQYQYFPLLVSTRLYPEFPFARLSHISEDLGKKVLISLLSIQENSKAAKDGKYARWLIPNDYSDVTNLMKELNVGAFKDFNKVTVEKVIEEYWHIMVATMVFFIVLVAFLLRIKYQQLTIQEHKNKLKKILDVQDSMIFLFDGEKIQDANLKFFQFFGISSLQEFYIKYSSIEHLFILSGDTINKEYFGQIWYEYIVSTPYEIHKVRMKNSHDETNVFKINVAMYDPKNSLFLVTMYDITTIEKLEKENENNFKLLYEQKKLTSMGEMIGNIAHQWRQPLSVMSTSVTGLQMQLECGLEVSQDKIIQSCELINNQTQYLSKTIDDFRNFIKNEDVKVTFSLGEVVENALSLTNASLEASQIKVLQDVGEDCILQGYPNELTQAIINILNNSKDAFLERKDSEENRYIFIAGQKISNTITLVIYDNAGGIQEEIVENIFEPYFTTKHQYQGTGIGLYMTRQIVTNHHKGTIRAKNFNFSYGEKKHRGAQFNLCFPLDKE